MEGNHQGMDGGEEKKRIIMATEKTESSETPENPVELESTCSHCNKLKEDVDLEAKKVSTLEKQLTKLEQDLMREGTLRHNLENEWQESREAYKTEVHILREQVRTEAISTDFYF